MNPLLTLRVPNNRLHDILAPLEIMRRDDARALRARASGRGHTRVVVRRGAGHQRGFSGGSAGGHARLRRPADPRPVVPQRRMNDGIQKTARRLVKMLAARDFAGLASWSKGARLNQNEMELAVREYGRTIIVPPGDAIPNLDVVKVTNADPERWSVDIPLWSKEEGRSDLTLEVTMIESGQELMHVEIDGIHVK